MAVMNIFKKLFAKKTKTVPKRIPATYMNNKPRKNVNNTNRNNTARRVNVRTVQDVFPWMYTNRSWKNYALNFPENEDERIKLVLLRKRKGKNQRKVYEYNSNLSKTVKSKLSNANKYKYATIKLYPRSNLY
jgi:hypothetical protein